MNRVAKLAVAACATGARIIVGATERDAARRVVRAIDDNMLYILMMVSSTVISFESIR